MCRTSRPLAALAASCCALLAFAAAASAREVLYGADGARGLPSNLYVLNPSTGAVLQNLGPIGFAVTGLAVDPTTGTLYGSTAQSPNAPNPGSLIRIDKTTGAGTLIGDMRPDVESAADITFTPDGALFGWLEADTDDLVRIDTVTGAAAVVGDSGLNTYGSGLASDSNGTLFYAGEGDQGNLFTINRATGAATPLSLLTGTTGDGIGALAFDRAGTLFGVLIDDDLATRPTELLTITPASGALNILGPSVDRLDAIVFDTLQVARTVTLDVNKHKVKIKKGSKKKKKVRFSGDVSAPDDAAGCEANLTLELQRKKPSQATFTTFAQVQTDAAGGFSRKLKVKKTFQYDVALGATPDCDDVLSNVEKVKVKKKKRH